MVKTKSYPQLKYIWTLARDCDLSPAELRALVKKNFPDTEGHLSRLSLFQARFLIDLLKRALNGLFSSETENVVPNSGEKENYRLGRQPRTGPRPPMSQAQYDLALELAHEISQLNPQEYLLISDSLEKIARHHGAVCFDACTTRQAFRVICALKSIKQKLFLTKV
jgi:hypothetical protein